MSNESPPILPLGGGGVGTHHSSLITHHFVDDGLTMGAAKLRRPVATVRVPTIRLDQLLVERGLSRSRESARAMIVAGDVRVDQQVETPELLDYLGRRGIAFIRSS